MVCSALRQLSSPLVLVPAYGRTYRSVEALRNAWEAGHDFKIFGGGPYTSIRDIEALKADSSSVTLSDFVSRINIRVG